MMSMDKELLKLSPGGGFMESFEQRVCLEQKLHKRCGIKSIGVQEGLKQMKNEAGVPMKRNAQDLKWTARRRLV